jgi:hypothetical protein
VKYSFFLLILLLSNVAGAVSQLDTWLGVEIVSDRSEQIDVARRLIDLPVGTRAQIPQIELTKKCNAVRSKFTANRINCRTVKMSGARLLFIVEIIDNFTNVPLESKCLESQRLSGELEAVSRLIDMDADRRLHALDGSTQEFVNDQGSLDYQDPLSHEHVKIFSELLKKYSNEIGALKHSCNSSDKQLALKFLSHTGDANNAVSGGLEFLGDSNEGVRNAAYRLISTFSRFVTNAEAGVVIRSACNNLKKISFLDRNKSLSVIYSLIQRDSNYIDKLDQDCVSKIRYIESTSISEQLHGFAEPIMKAIIQKN